MRLDLPVQAVTDRGRPDDAPLLVLGEAVIDGTTTVFMGLPDGGYGPEPGDPAGAADLDSRGWHCAPGSSCVWIGLV
ncbi:hypothetical protein [Streptomyces sp. NPDC004267]|uniref:hypothetical protein n=1 Tax=Streptomyces sp. NPDC004267 TaxID=3364694 RepID=UPI0036AD3EC2